MFKLYQNQLFGTSVLIQSYFPVPLQSSHALPSKNSHWHGPGDSPQILHSSPLPSHRKHLAMLVNGLTVAPNPRSAGVTRLGACVNSFDSGLAAVRLGGIVRPSGSPRELPGRHPPSVAPHRSSALHSTKPASLRHRTRQRRAIVRGIRLQPALPSQMLCRTKDPKVHHQFRWQSVTRASSPVYNETRCWPAFVRCLATKGVVPLGLVAGGPLPWRSCRRCRTCQGCR